jgi:hypothetical protein
MQDADYTEVLAVHEYSDSVADDLWDDSMVINNISVLWKEVDSVPFYRNIVNI